MDAQQFERLGLSVRSEDTAQKLATLDHDLAQVRFSGLREAVSRL